MFIPLHHKNSGQLFFIPASHIVIIDQVTLPNKIDVKLPGQDSTHIHTVITKGQNTLTFEVRESPEEVATLVNEMLHTSARSSRTN